MFVDASAAVAILASEKDGPAYDLALANSHAAFMSAISFWETVAALVKTHAYSVPEARAITEELVKLAKIQIVGIGERELTAALDAYDQFGKGRHPAQLNMGDCFAYACAKTLATPLLFKGGDFTKTDIEAVSFSR